MTRPYRPTRAEMETVIRWDREEQVVQIWSADPVTWRKMARLMLEPIKETRFPGGPVSGRFYRLPLTRFRWGLRRVGGAGNPSNLRRARVTASAGSLEPEARVIGHLAGSDSSPASTARSRRGGWPMPRKPVMLRPVVTT